MTEGYAPVNGLKMYYRTHGAGDPLVLLHGGLLTAELSFGELIPRLAERHRVIAVELQGHGRTADTDREASVPGFADDVVGLLDHLDIRRADLYGFSLGGLTAMQVALTHPERVRKLVAASIQFRPDGFHEEIRNPDRWATSRRMPTADDFAAMRADYRRVAPDPDHFDAFQEKVSAAVGAFPGWSDDQLRGLAVPTLVMAGDTDFMPVEHAAEMVQLIPDAQLAVLPGCTHMDLTRRPDLVLPAVSAFLA
ncbi:alpha/beta hydrolase [Pseudonocardia eucalypti]|uniref:Alpha/beta hydrolase n=1 Tax=Pseudonocardia eucalypti TaxID=648755 RepID=A0ABP9RF00_9PSEU|nr:pimeloyl-ACP methyl ester carboxylesterase [Pseudonocardia eucalypti]